MPVAGKAIHVSSAKNGRAIIVRPRSKTSRFKPREGVVRSKPNFQLASVGLKTRSGGTARGALCAPFFIESDFMRIFRFLYEFSAGNQGSREQALNDQPVTDCYPQQPENTFQTINFRINFTQSCSNNVKPSAGLCYN
jgi:hypothetical protein